MKTLSKIIMAILLMASFASCSNSQAHKSGSSSKSSSEESSIDPYELYSEWWECVDVEVIPGDPTRGQVIGQDVVVKNICSHTIKQVTVSVYCDGYSQELNYRNMKPGATDRKTVSVMADADLDVTDIQIEF